MTPAPQIEWNANEFDVSCRHMLKFLHFDRLVGAYYHGDHVFAKLQAWKSSMTAAFPLGNQQKYFQHVRVDDVR